MEGFRGGIGLPCLFTFSVLSSELKTQAIGDGLVIREGAGKEWLLGSCSLAIGLPQLTTQLIAGLALC